MYFVSREIQGSQDAWSEVPEDLAERVAALLSRILSQQFDAKITFVAVKRSGSGEVADYENKRTA